MAIGKDTISQVHLENRSQGHYKFYEVTVTTERMLAIDQPGSYFVYGRYGKIGNLGTTVSKHPRGGFSSKEAALDEARSIIEEKSSKGYAVVRRFDSAGKMESNKPAEPRSRLGNILRSLKE